ncbi:hypothetical protein D3C87_1881080 [compost metagenome]
MPLLRKAEQARAVGRRPIDGVDALPRLAADDGCQPRLRQQAVHLLCQLVDVSHRSKQLAAAGGMENFVQAAGCISHYRLAEGQAFQRSHTEALADQAGNHQHIHGAIDLRKTLFIAYKFEM